MKKIKRKPSSPPPPTDHRTLLKILRESKRPLSPDDFLPMLGLHRRKKGDVDGLLKDLVAQGKLIQLGKAYAPMERVNLITGKVQVQRSGVAFLIPDDPRRKDVFLGQDTAGAWHGDKVAVAITRENERRNHEGRVVRIIERGKSVLTVRIMRSAGPGSFLCRPTDPRLDFAVLTHDTDTALGLEKGDIALVAPGDQVDAAVWEGVVLSRLGPENEAGVQESLVKTNHGVPTSFPKAALDEAAALPAAPAEADYLGAGAKRQDLRALPFVTIDGATARDFDDAIYVEKKGRDYRLWVAIADVAHYVPTGSALDLEAYERGNSYYFPASVEPMFPHALSNGLCSLNPSVPRLSVAVCMDMSERGLPGEVRVMNAVIESHARLTYDRARDVCVDKLPAARAELATESGDDVVAMLDLAEQLARQMRTRRIERGSLDFDLPEGEVRFDDAGNPVAVEPRERHFAHQLIEEFMIAANEAVSEFLQAHALPCLYRVHAEPDREKLETLYMLLSRLDGEAAPKRARAGRFSDEDFTPEALGRMLASVAGTEREFLVHRMVLRSMKQARYQPDNEGHFGLASESYAHFTSPIRRYADLIVHRLVKRALGDQHMPVPGFKRLAEMGQHLSGRERISQEAERECHKRYACMVLRGQEGREFHAVVSSLMDYGFWVELPDVMAEGFIRLSTMLDDYYGYLKEREMLLGERTGRVIRVGQAVRAKLIGVHLDRLEIDLELAPDAGSPAATPRLDGRERRAVEDSRRQDRARQKRRTSGGSSSGKPGEKSGATSGARRTNAGKPAGKSGGKPRGR